EHCIGVEFGFGEGKRKFPVERDAVAEVISLSLGKAHSQVSPCRGLDSLDPVDTKPPAFQLTGLHGRAQSGKTLLPGSFDRIARGSYDARPRASVRNGKEQSHFRKRRRQFLNPEAQKCPCSGKPIIEIVASCDQW